MLVFLLEMPFGGLELVVWRSEIGSGGDFQGVPLRPLIRAISCRVPGHGPGGKKKSDVFLPSETKGRVPHFRGRSNGVLAAVNQLFGSQKLEIFCEK